MLANLFINKDTKFYDLCCGSGSITLELINRGVAPNRITMLDKGSWGKFWSSVGKGEFDLRRFKELVNDIPTDKNQIQEYLKQLSKQDANVDEEYVYLLLQAGSFGSKQIWKENNKWCNTSFRSYWLPTATSSRRSPVNPMMPMPDTLYQRVENIVNNCKGLVGYNTDIYDILDIVDSYNNVFYIDPPYRNTTAYGFTFDLSDFVSELQYKHGTIYVSEGCKMHDEAYLLNQGRSKGGISGDRGSANSEWLNIYY